MKNEIYVIVIEDKAQEDIPSVAVFTDREEAGTLFKKLLDKNILASLHTVDLNSAIELHEFLK